MFSSIPLPNYVVINDPSSTNKEVLRTPAKKVEFPLDKSTKEIISVLEKKFDQEENCAGLAATQIGYNCRIIIFAVEDTEDIKKLRSDVTDTLPKSIWINPSWIPLTTDVRLDWEACFSVSDCVARVSRFTKIAYKAWTTEGKICEGTAHGFLARLIQHEIDHLNGKLFIDYVPEDQRLTKKQYLQLIDQEEQ